MIPLRYIWEEMSEPNLEYEHGSFEMSMDTRNKTKQWAKRSKQKGYPKR